MTIDRYLTTLMVYFVLQGIVLGQAKKLTYRLQGIVNRDTGTVILLPVAGQAYDPNTKNKYQAKIKQGRFLLEGQMAYPGGYLIRIDQNYVSSNFIIEPGSQIITCNADSLREIPKLATQSMAEHHIFTTRYVQPFTKKREQDFDEYRVKRSTITDERILDSLRTTYQQKQAILIHQQQLQYLDYTSQHPNSYVALWHLVRNMGEGYQPIFDSIYTALSPSLRNTPTGKMVAQRIKLSKATAIGQVFPSLTLVDTSNMSASIAPDHRSKYTLIDFWFSHCGPCLQEFPKLKDLFAQYQYKGFNIIGISIDKPADIETWKKTIQEKNLVWPQYLDLSGKITVGQFSISYFPSNFLLDDKGIIIRKNINSLDLSNFLSQRM